MYTLEDVNLTYLIITNQWWGKGTDLPALKKKASRKGVFKKGEKRTYFAYLVHKDTVIENEQFVFPHPAAADTALRLGKV